MMGLGGMLGTTAVVAEMTSKVHGSAANVVEHRVGLALAVRTVDLLVYPQTRLSVMMLARVTLLRLETWVLVAAMIDMIAVTLKLMV